ncbi:hypothetical protein GCM10010106_40630 [Thermopolyspora flexuosa]|jgi:hypothetical protein|uniref:Uncharacterized protein n=1 Tax=Thermopolyspora flexuosa TaxID=103836 RepID=A0A543IUC6_9ACTN|nr:hypothetical protein [Thermopolyspora flexuosa]TQM74174.1 hypothetical protein FHX40_0838 [Thermopolyspora flexuosa]GGM89143.1 hypothetical protein GCM10010106_40630 [Thermopolyspora flexuosa]
MTVRQQERRRAEQTGNIIVGRPDTTIDAPAHTKGVNQGNLPGHYERQIGHLLDGRSTAARSTGINAADRDPIDPSSPNLSPP